MLAVRRDSIVGLVVPWFLMVVGTLKFRGIEKP